MKSFHPLKAITFKWIVFMKLNFLLIFVFSLHVSAHVNSQDRFALNFNNVSIDRIFHKIQKESDYRFFYNNRYLKDIGKVDINVSDATLSEIMDIVLSKSLRYRVINRSMVVISPAEQIDEQVVVKGRVTDSLGIPLQGVTIRVKNGSAGVATDENGEFSLAVADDAILLVSYIGYETQEVPVYGRTTVDIRLIPSAAGLNQVIVVGYGTQKKANLTGAVASVNGEELLNRPLTNPAAMLQGTMSGVQVRMGTGEPGNENVNIRIRGTGTFSAAGSNPLVLIDGVEGNLTDINPINIESVSVLKDAASAAIYGARAANGVILVTTKTGTSGEMTIQYSGNYAVHTPTKMFDLVTNSVEYMEMYNEALTNSGIGVGHYPSDVINSYRNATDRALYPNTDWLDMLFNPAPTQMHNLVFNGGTNALRYNVSMGYVNQKGVMEGFDYEKFNIRANLTSQAGKNIKFGAIIGLMKGNKSGPRTGSEDIFLATMAQAPTYSPQLADGSGRFTYKAYDWERNNKNPFALIYNDVDLNTTEYNISPQGWVDVQLLKGLSWYTKAAINASFNKSDDFRPQISGYNFRTHDFVRILSIGGGGVGLTARNESNFYSNLYSYLNYSRSFGGDHSFKAQAGYSYEENTWEYLSGYRMDYLNDNLQQLDAGSPSVQNANGNKEEWAIRSYFGRLNYGFRDRYLFEANLRYDGSSRLSPEGRWGTFPSVSAAWRISEENFIRNLDFGWLNSLKLRASYGKLGNQNIALYPYQALLSLTGNYPFDDASLVSGVAQTGLSNRNIKWETTTMTDIGLDIALFNGLSVTFDWYNKTTTDILRGSQVTYAVGLNAPTINNGTLENKGVELGVVYNRRVVDDALNGLNYSVGANLEHYKNKVVDFGNQEISGYRVREEGREWDSYYMLEWIGIFQSQDEIDRSPTQYNDALVPGDLKFKDQNGDGKVNDDDRIPMAGNFPSLNYSFNFTAEWKGLDLYLMLQGVENQKFYVTDWGTVPFHQGAPPTTNWLNRWTPENPSTTMPIMYFRDNAPTKILRPSSWYLQDASYLRIKNLTIGYTLGSSLVGRFGVDKLRLYFSGENILTSTKYPGLDPERNTSGRFVAYPQNKIYSFGVNVQF